MQFVVLGKYSTVGLAGLVKNPNEDRKSVINDMMSKAGATLDHFLLTRGEYDIVAMGNAPEFETIAAIKMLIMSSGALSEITILEVSDFNKIAAKASEMTGAYKAPG